MGGEARPLTDTHYGALTPTSTESQTDSSCKLDHDSPASPIDDPLEHLLLPDQLEVQLGAAAFMAVFEHGHPHGCQLLPQGLHLNG